MRTRSIRSIAATLLALLVLCLMALPSSAQAIPSRAQMDSWFLQYATMYGSENDLDSSFTVSELYEKAEAVSKCETLNWTSWVGDNGLSVGPMQFHQYGIWPATPQAQAGYSRWDFEANIAGGVYLISRGYGPQHWYYCWRHA